MADGISGETRGLDALLTAVWLQPLPSLCTYVLHQEFMCSRFQGGNASRCLVPAAYTRFCQVKVPRIENPQLGKMSAFVLTCSLNGLISSSCIIKVCGFGTLRCCHQTYQPFQNACGISRLQSETTQEVCARSLRFRLMVMVTFAYIDFQLRFALRITQVAIARAKAPPFFPIPCLDLRALLCA